MDLIRQILLAVESQSAGYSKGNPQIDDFTEEQIGYHAYLMKQAGLVDAIDTSGVNSESPQAQILSLTWNGHEFLDAAKSNKVWALTKEKAKTVGGSLTFEMLKELLVATARSQLGLP